MVHIDLNACQSPVYVLDIPTTALLCKKGERVPVGE